MCLAHRRSKGSLCEMNAASLAKISSQRNADSRVFSARWKAFRGDAGVAAFVYNANFGVSGVALFGGIRSEGALACMLVAVPRGGAADDPISRGCPTSFGATKRARWRRWRATRRRGSRATTGTRPGREGCKRRKHFVPYAKRFPALTTNPSPLGRTTPIPLCSHSAST